MKQMNISGKAAAIISAIILASILSTGATTQPLSNIVKSSSNLESVDADSNGIIDLAEKAQKVQFSQITGLNICQNQYLKGIKTTGAECAELEVDQQTCEGNTVYPQYYTGSGGVYYTNWPCPNGKELVYFSTDYYSATYYCC